MSSGEECGIHCKCFKCKGRKHVGLSRIASNTSSDSDSPVAKNVKRKKIPRVLDDGPGNSSETDSFEISKRKKRKQTPRVMSDEEESSGSGPRPARRKSSAQVVSESEEESSSDEYESSGIDNKEEEEEVVEAREARESDDASSDSWEDGEESGSGSSGWESDWTSVEEDCVEDVGTDRVAKPTNKSTSAASSRVETSNLDSDSSDGQSEKCPICLRNFASQEVGTPESCDHSFCAVCLQEWAKNMNTCPVDRQAFTLILVRSCLEGKIIRRIPVEPREHREDDEEIHEDPTPCEICGRCDREDRLLLCDQCDSGYHLECLDPPLETVPVEEWFCPECVVANSTQIADEAPIGEGELFDLIDDAQATIGISPLRRRINRLLPRTRQSERVRSTIIRHEIERQAEAGNTHPSTSSGVDSLDSASRLSLFFGGRHPAKVKRKLVRKKRKRKTRKVRRRKTTSTKTKSKTTTTSTVSTTKKSATTKRKVKKTKKTKRRTKKKTVKRRSKGTRCRVARTTVPHSVKGRLAEQLGMRAPKIPGQMLPSVCSRNTPNNINFQRSLAGIPTLHIFGQPDQIDFFSSSSDIEEDIGGAGVDVLTLRRRASTARSEARSLAKRKLLTPSAVRSHTMLEPPRISTGPVDLIGSILDSQTVWHSKKAVVSINRDRSFTVTGSTDKKTSGTPPGPSSPSQDSLLRKGDTLTGITNEKPVNVKDASATGTQVPMYPGRDGSGGSRPPSGGGYQNFGNPRYSSTYGNYQGARNFVPFGSSSNYDNRDNRAEYSDYLQGGPPAPFPSGSPVSFRMPIRFPQRQAASEGRDETDNSGPEESKKEDGEWKNSEENSNEDDEVDIYSDIEVAAAGEDPESRPQMFDSLPPPPLPPAMLIGLGEQESDDDSDEDLVIDDKTPQVSSPRDVEQPVESDKYDPAEPSYDSDTPIELPEDIPLPSEPPLPLPVDLSSKLSASRSQIVANSSNSNKSHLKSPCYDDSNSRSAIVVSQVVKEVIKVHLEASSSANEERCDSSLDGDDEGECPNFSIYSAASMDIARNSDTDAIVEPTPVTEHSTGNDFDEGSLENGNDDISQTSNVSPGIEDLTTKERSTPDFKDENSIDSDLEKSSTHAEDACSNESKENEEKNLGEKLDKNDSLVYQIEGHTEERQDDSEIDALEDSVSKDTKSSDTEGNNKMHEVTSESENMIPEGEMEASGSCHDSDLEPDKHQSLLTEETQVLEKANITGTDEESLVGGATSSVSAASSSHTPPHPPTGLEGLDTEDISETEEAIHFDDLSDTSFATVEEDGEIPSKRKKKRSRRPSGELPKSGDENLHDSPSCEPIDYEEGEIVEAPKKDTNKDKETNVNKESDISTVDKVTDENVDITKKSSKSLEEDKKKKKKKDKDKVNKKGSKDRAVLGSKENKDKAADKASKDDPNIAWKKPSKAKERNYRDKGKGDGNNTKTKEGSKKRTASKERDKESGARKEKERKKKDKRQDMERYDVRKIVNDKKRTKRRDEFGRDLLRDRSYTRSRSLSYSRPRGRSRSISRDRNNRMRRSPLKLRRQTRSRSRARSLSRTKYRNRTRSRSPKFKNRSRSRSLGRSKARARSRERTKKSRSRDRTRRYSLERSRNRKRSRSRSRSKSRNRSRNRSRSRTPIRSRDRKDRGLNVQEPRFHYSRRSLSPSWTPSWSGSGSFSGSSYSRSRSRSTSPRKQFRSYSRSYSRSWTPDHRIQTVSKKTGAMTKNAKKLTVTVTNTKEVQKKKEKKKKDIKKKDQHSDKKRKRKDRSPAPSKEVFTSGDNILVSVNFNKSNKGASKDTSNLILTKDTSKRKTTEDAGKNAAKKVRKDANKDKLSPQGVKARLGEKKSKKNAGPRLSRIAALSKKKPMAIIDLDQSPFREQTPSPLDLIVLSDSEDEIMNKEVGEEVNRRVRENSASPKGSSKTGTNTATNVSESQSPIMNNIGSYLVTSTGPKTPPEPQVKFSIAPKQTLRSIMNPLQEDEDLQVDTIMDNIDRRIEEELNRNMGELMHKGPNTPPEPRGPSTPCSSPTSPDAYDPFDPTKSRSPSPERPESGLDRPSPAHTPTVDLTAERDSPPPNEQEDPIVTQEVQVKSPTNEVVEGAKSPEKVTVDSTTKSPALISNSPLPSVEPLPDLTESPDKTKQSLVVSTSADSGSKSPDRNSGTVSSQTSKPTPTKQFVVKPTAVSQGSAVNSTSSHSTVPSSPVIAALTSANIATMLRATPPSTLPNRNIFAQPSSLSITQLITHHNVQHHQFLGSPAVTQRLPPVIERPTSQKTLPLKPVPIKPSPQKISPQKTARTLNGDQILKDKSTDVVDMDLESPYSPGSSEANDLFEPPVDISKRSTPKKKHPMTAHKSPAKVGDKFDNLFGDSPLRGKRQLGRQGSAKHIMKNNKTKGGGKFEKGGKNKKEIGIKMDEEKLQILAELPSSAVELQVKDKWLKKLNRQERVVEEVKLSLKPHYAKKHITKEEYKDVLRRSVPKICHNRSGEINPIKIASLVEAYVKRVRYKKKKAAVAAGIALPKPKPKTSMWS